MDAKQQRKDAKGRYKQLLALVGRVMADWDPLGFLSLGAPDDEFRSEIAAVAAQVPRIKSSTDAAHAVSRVFSLSFDREEFELTVVLLCWASLVCCPGCQAIHRSAPRHTRGLLEGEGHRR
jgi:hypothetical protein